MTLEQDQEQEQERVETVPGAQAVKKHPRIGRYLLLALVLVIIPLTFLIHAGITSRALAESELVQETHEAAIPYVSVMQPKHGAPSQELVIPGNIQAFSDAPIYARTNGYLKRWYADIGARVQAGQLLAEIDTPEVDQQLQQARADLETAQANYRLAQTTADRYQGLLKTESVSQQETDQAVAGMHAKKAMVDSAASNVHRLQDLQSYEKIYAPFAGVVTARNTDVGALINSGAGTAGRELFHIAALDRLRVFVSVPEVNSNAARPGVVGTLTLSEFPGRTFTGHVARNSNAIDPASRTLLVELDVNNPTGELLPGAYVSVHLKLPSNTARAMIIPVNTLLFRSEGLRVGVVRNGKAELAPIVIGRDFGNEVEVVSGLSAKDRVIVNPPDSLTTGQPVRTNTQSGGGVS